MTWKHYSLDGTVHLVESNQDDVTLCEITCDGSAVPVAEDKHPLETSPVCTTCRVAYAEQEYTDRSITADDLAEGDAIAYWSGDPFDPTSDAVLQTGVIEETPPVTTVTDVQKTDGYRIKRGPRTLGKVGLECIYETGLDPEAVVKPDIGGEIADNVNEAMRESGIE